jgi:hypothetical protein
MQQSEREGDTPPSAKVRNKCSYTSAPPIHPRGPYSDNFSFCATDISAVPHLHEILSAFPSRIKNWCNRNKHSRQPEARCTSCGYFRETNRHYIYTSPPRLWFVPAATRCDLHSRWKVHHFKVQQLSATFLTRLHPSLVWRSVRYSNKHTLDSAQTAHLFYMGYSNQLS